MSSRRDLYAAIVISGMAITGGAVAATALSGCGETVTADSGPTADASTGSDSGGAVDSGPADDAGSGDAGEDAMVIIL